LTVAGVPWLPPTVPDRSRLVALGCGRVFVVDVGPQVPASRLPPIVLVHGLLCTHFAFDRLIPRLARDRRVIALDLPGTGDSDRPDPRDADQYSPRWLAERLAELLSCLDVPVVDVLGHDYGGAVAAMFAATFPERIGRLALMGPLLLNPSVPFEGTLRVAASLGVDVFRRTVSRADIARALAQGVCTPELVSTSEIHVYWDRLGRRGGREATYAMLAQLGGLVRMREPLAALQTPTWLIWGDRDRLVPCEQAARLAALLPGAPQVEVIDGCGHNPAREQPERLARILESMASGGLATRA